MSECGRVDMLRPYVHYAQKIKCRKNDDLKILQRCAHIRGRRVALILDFLLAVTSREHFSLEEEERGEGGGEAKCTMVGSDLL